jgi:acyl carrier protein
MLPTMSDSRRGSDPGCVAAHAALPTKVDTISDGADLFQAGIVSFASVKVMLGLEEAFDIEFPDSMLTREVFRSVDAIATAVGSLTD